MARAREPLNRSSVDTWSSDCASLKVGLATGTFMTITKNTEAKQSAFDLAPGRAY